MTTTPYKSITTWANTWFYIPTGIEGSEFNDKYREDNWSIKYPEVIEPLRNYAIECDKQNMEIYNQIAGLYNEYKQKYDALFHPNKKTDKKLLAAFELVIPPVPQNQTRKLRDYLERVQRAFEVKQLEEQKKRAIATQNFEAIRLQTAAIEFIKNNSCQYIFDYEKGEIKFNQETMGRSDKVFPITHAIELANELRFEQLKSEAGDEIDHSCCDECSSWDPSERRCSCGNRRMSWSYDGNFEDMTIYPEAY